jgi:hypothetical protein
MSNRFPPLRPQSALTRPASRALFVAAPIDLTLLAALALIVAVALV